MGSELPSFVRDWIHQNNGSAKTDLLDIEDRAIDDYETGIRFRRDALEVKSREHEAVEIDYQKVLQEIEDLKEVLEFLSSSVIERVKNWVVYNTTKKELEGSLKKLEMSTQKMQQIQEELLRLGREFPDGAQIGEIGRKVETFYNEALAEWENGPYDREEILENFNEEHLSGLSLEEYILLLKRYPQDMVTHVTRQGIRDHTGMVSHAAGVGDFASGFTGILQDGKMRSPFGVYMSETDKERAMAHFLHLDMLSRQEAEEHLEIIFGDSNIGGQASYADRNAVHFAGGEVADNFYGSERGNEIFLAYPAAYIVAEHCFSRSLKGGVGYWDDIWVWDKDQKGMDINSALVFIPEDAQVDSDTGSRYKLNSEGKAIEREKLLDDLEKFAFSDSFLDGIDRLRENLEVDEEALEENVKKWKNEFPNISDFIQLLASDYYGKMLSICGRAKKVKDLESKKTDTNQTIIDSELVSDRFFLRNTIQEFLRTHGEIYEKVDNTVSSKDYWEAYFTKHPDQKPSKIVYYKGGDPSRALNQFMDEHGLIKRLKENEGDFGFAEKKLDSRGEIPNEGRDRFKELAMRVMEKWYQDN